MALFDQIINAIDNPQQLANSGQLASILDTIDQIGNNSQTNPSSVQSLMSIVGKYVRPALQQKRDNEGTEQAQAFVNQFSGTQPSFQAVELLLSTPQIQQIVQEAEQRTGLTEGTIRSMLPTLVPLVLNLLKTGTSAENPQGSNSVLSAFLDSDRDGDVDLADAMQMAGRYLGRLG